MNILLPIETINREIDFKLVLASYLSGKGHQIYIGQHDFLMSLVPKMKVEGGLYIGKNIFNLDASIEKGEKYYFLKKNNFNIIYLNEEGAIFLKGEQEMTKRFKKLYNMDFFDENDDVCVWGSIQKKIEDKRASNVCVHATGHPRFDLCKKEWHSLYQSKVKTLFDTYNDFILINGNYVGANHGLGNEHLFLNKEHIDVEKRLKFINSYNYTSKQLSSMIHLTHHLAVLFPKLNFIYRPHPSEDHNYYELAFAAVENIYVKHDGPVMPWILASKLLLHDGCTTAIEASLAEKPVINYKPILDNYHDIWLPNQMGTRMTTIDEVVFYIKEMSRSNFNFPSQHINEKVLKFLYNFNGNSYEAFLKIIEKKIDKGKINSNVSITNIKKIFLKISIRDFLIKILKPYKRKHLSYHNTKFYGFSETDVSQKFENISKLLRKKIIYKFHNSHLISIQ